MSSVLNPLHIPELFYMVLRFLAEPTVQAGSGFPFLTPDSESQRALASLARTCRAFAQPALDYLWRRLSSLEPLLWCFTSRQAFLTGRPLHPPSAADWLIIKRYAYRIQQLEVQNDFSTFFLGCAMFEVDLFPNLQALKWGSRSRVNHVGISLIQPLLNPRMLVLDICGTEHDMALGSFLDACPSRCPGVLAFRLCVSVQQNFELIKAYSRTFPRFKDLKALHVEPFVTDSALHCLLMSNIQELNLTIWPHQFRRISMPPSVIPLPNIRELDLRLPRLSMLTALLRPGHQSFNIISFVLLNPESAMQINTFFLGLATQPQKSRLRSLHLRSPRNCARIDNRNLFILSFDVLRPLTYHANLRELVLDLENPISLNDKELENLARNWPSLHRVELCYLRRWPHEAKRMTFRGLLSLVSLCPKLHYVGLSLDGRDVPSDVPGELRFGAVKTLYFPNSRIDKQTRLVARFLLTHFPSLISVSDIEPSHVHGRIGEWAEVAEYVADPGKLEREEPVNNYEGDTLIPQLSLPSLPTSLHLPTLLPLPSLY